MTRLSRNSWLISAVVLLIGFLFLHFKIVDYGASFFVLFPFAVGFSIGTLEKKHQVSASLIFGLLIFMGLLLASALEGLVCVLMALPIFVIMILLGSWVQKRLLKKPPKDDRKLMISMTPIVILLIASPIEQMIMPEPKVITIENSIKLNYPPELVFDEVKQMEKLDAEKPMGLWMGLPAPYKCELEADSVGALRYCHFENGQIIAQITKYEKGKILEMDVINYTLTGRDWFQFVDAVYRFEELSSGVTKITRTSSYKSMLNPGFYWRPLEAWGIDQEHQFVLNSLKKNLSEKYPL